MWSSKRMLSWTFYQSSSVSISAEYDECWVNKTSPIQNTPLLRYWQFLLWGLSPQIKSLPCVPSLLWVCACLDVMCNVCRWHEMPENDIRSPGTGVIGCCDPSLYWWWAPNSGPLKELRFALVHTMFLLLEGWFCLHLSLGSLRGWYLLLCFFH